MAYSALRQVFAQLFLLVVVSCSLTPIVPLDYGTFQGNYSSTYNITYFRKIPFAAPPVGENRFRAPQPPSQIEGIYDSDQTFDFCPQRTVNGSEDCLYLGLYSRPWDQSVNTKRPVVVVFFGGAFIEGGGSFVIPPSGYPILNASELNDFIFVYPNYRVNAFGFLPGKAIKDSPTSDLNPGLLDQQYVLKWVNQYIDGFGGDPNNVTIWGQSAGAGSVVAQAIANGQTSPRLFSKALVSSGFWPKTYRYDEPQAEAIYSSLVEMTGCSNTSHSDSLACLKAIDVQTIRTAALAISGTHTYNTSSYTWAPVIDGTFLPELLSEATAKGHVNIDFGWGMYNEFEGENFIPPGLQGATNSGGFNSSQDSFEDWLQGFLPSLTGPDIEKVKEIYPVTGTTHSATYNTTYIRAELIYRDLILACPGYFVAKAAKEVGFIGEYTISPATHGSDTEWWDQVGTIQKTQPVIYEGFAGAFASFFQTGDPNAHKLTNSTQPGVPQMSTSEKFVIESTGFQNIGNDVLEERCEFWRGMGPAVPM